MKRNNASPFANASRAFLEMNRDKLEAAAKKPRRRSGGGGHGGPNATEREFNRTIIEGKGQYEALTFRLPGGSRYTPDWVVFTPHAVYCFEVKGSYRFPSEGRALTAFREARAAFPTITFEWWQKGKDGQWYERHPSCD